MLLAWGTPAGEGTSTEIAARIGRRVIQEVESI
jgi:hypothetical protein